MLFSLLKHYFELYITDTALKVSPFGYCFTTSISHGVEIISPGCGVRASLMIFFFTLDLVTYVLSVFFVQGRQSVREYQNDFYL